MSLSTYLLIYRSIPLYLFILCCLNYAAYVINNSFFHHFSKEQLIFHITWLFIPDLSCSVNLEKYCNKSNAIRRKITQKKKRTFGIFIFHFCVFIFSFFVVFRISFFIFFYICTIYLLIYMHLLIIFFICSPQRIFTFKECSPPKKLVLEIPIYLLSLPLIWYDFLSLYLFFLFIK